jgi:hypothetical protein
MIAPSTSLLRPAIVALGDPRATRAASNRDGGA